MVTEVTLPYAKEPDGHQELRKPGRKHSRSRAPRHLPQTLRPKLTRSLGMAAPAASAEWCGRRWAGCFPRELESVPRGVVV